MEVQSIVVSEALADDVTVLERTELEERMRYIYISALSFDPLASLAIIFSSCSEMLSWKICIIIHLPLLLLLLI